MAVTKKKKADIANAAIRVFLQKVGESYDSIRGHSQFGPNKKQWNEVLEFFGGCCCYCGRNVRDDSIRDHLIPLNKRFLGLHCWGNIVPCCASCNDEKHHKPWEEFLALKWSGSQLKSRSEKIKAFVSYYKYSPNLDLGQIVDHLYEDVGEVAFTLINLRIRQAEKMINRIHNVERPVMIASDKQSSTKSKPLKNTE